MSATTVREADVVAAGGVLWRPGTDGGWLVALVHRPRYDDWSLPKGKLDKGEAPAAAAVREIAEETGWRSELGPRLGEVHYQVPEGLKVVHWWSARAVSGEFTANHEVDVLRWLPAAEAGPALSYPHDREVLARFLALAPPPAPLLLVRHAKAGSRERWAGDDALRPLSGDGRTQAEALTPHLELFGPRRVHSAPLVRCVETVAPLAARLGVDVVPEPLLSEDAFADDPDAAEARLRELAAEPGVTVVCSQGGAIPNLVARLTGLPDPAAKKASTWALGFAGDRVVTHDHYPPPA
ncbi:MAG TPA: NUDIX hydrolase [Pseudonocardia sp.]